MNDGSEFDFLIGDWIVHHRRLATRLAGASDWQEFGGTSTAMPLLGGLGNVDDNLLRLPGCDYRAVSLRSFDRATGIWSIWWLDGRHPQKLDVPVRGTFADGNAEFFANDEFCGKPIKVRFRWTGTDTGSPCWEQAFSADDGATWEVNWTMDFKRPS
jgi:hypothetical protein